MIKAVNVVKIFASKAGVVRAVDKVSTEVARGEVVVINGKYGLRLVDIVDDQALSPQEA